MLTQFIGNDTFNKSPRIPRNTPSALLSVDCCIEIVADVLPRTGLLEFAGGRSQVEIEYQAATLDSALSALWTICPGMRDRVLTEQGEVRRHINIFVGEENIRYTGGLATPVSAQSNCSRGQWRCKQRARILQF